MRVPVRVTATSLVFAVLLATAGCMSESPEDSAATTAPGADPAASGPKQLTRDPTPGIRLAQRQFELLTEGKWAAAWQDWTPAAQQRVPQKVFVAVNTTCPADAGVHFDLTKVQPLDDSTVTLRFRTDGGERGATARFAAGTWRIEPDTATLSEYAAGTDPAVAARRAKNACPGR